MKWVFLIILTVAGCTAPREPWHDELYDKGHASRPVTRQDVANVRQGLYHIMWTAAMLSEYLASDPACKEARERIADIWDAAVRTQDELERVKTQP